MSSNTMNAFAATTGVKGSDCYTSTSSHLNDFYIRLNRGLPEADIQTYIDAVFRTGSAQDKVDLFVLAFQTRDIRGGKGERDLFRHIWLNLSLREPEAAAATVSLVPEYGYWEDLNQLAHKTKGRGHNVARDDGGDWLLRETILQTLLKQLAEDETAVVASSMNPELGAPKLSLLARHLPREGNAKAEDAALAKELAHRLYPSDKERNKKYRQRVAALAKVLAVPEVAMAAKNWSSLEPSKLPGRCLKTKLKGLLNQPVKSKHGRKVELTSADRVACAEKFKAHLSRAAKGEAKVKGANTVFPHELVAKVLKHLQAPATVQKWVSRGSYEDEYDSYDDDGDQYGYGGGAGQYVESPNPDRLSPEELDGFEAQWRSIVGPIKALGVLGEWLAMCDFSGSMAGDPMYVSFALGLIIAECNTGVFKNCILTFDSTPTLYRFKTAGFVSRIQELVTAGVSQGLSTDFQAAYNLVLKTLIDSGVAAADAPKYLLVLTDMGFDKASSHGGVRVSSYRHAVKTAGHETHVQIARRAFVKQGEALFGDGKGWAAPTVVVWNLRDLPDFQAKAQEEGVLQVSGWSPSLLKLLATRGAGAFNSEAILRIALDDPRYDPVRAAVGRFFPADRAYDAARDMDAVD
jgi:hypothetical protein